MLHRIKLPSCKDILYDFVQFQKQLLEFACTPSLSDPLIDAEARLKGFFQNHLGDWLWEKKLWEVDGTVIQPTDLANLIIAMTGYIKANPDEREKILAAFEHDIDFYNHMDDSDFHFAYQQLQSGTKEKVKPLMIHCYHLLRGGFPLNTSPRPEHFNRQMLVDTFWEENEVRLTVCPACDGQRPRRTHRKVYSDTDHFLPESLYPFLSVHPFNLVSICTDCNRYFKLKTDPIENHNNETLIDIFHPYARPAIDHIEVQIVTVARGANRVQISDRSIGNASSCLKNLNRVLRLQETWSGSYLDDAIADICRLIRDLRRYRTDRKEAVIDPDFVKDILENIKQSYMEKVGLETWYIVKHSYACYALSHPDELNRLVQRLMGEEEEAINNRR